MNHKATNNKKSCRLCGNIWPCNGALQEQIDVLYKRLEQTERDLARIHRREEENDPVTGY